MVALRHALQMTQGKGSKRQPIDISSGSVLLQSLCLSNPTRDQFFCKLSLVLTIYLAVETICPRWWLSFKLITVIFDKDLSDERVYVNDIIYCEISIYKLLLWFVFIMLVTQWIIRERQLGQSRILLCYHYN